MGKQIRIYLADSAPSGIRHAEITNWTGQALACPRSRFQDLRDWDEVKRPGVYFLFGTTEDTGDDAVYIGESEIVVDRLSSHLTGKVFWGELVAFTSKDDNLTKSHVKYLEARLIQLATVARRYRLTNSAAPQLPTLPRPDRDAMEEYLDSVRTLLGVLGHKVLEPLLPRISQSGSASEPAVAPTVSPSIESLDRIALPGQSAVFHLNIAGLDARATRSDEGVVVLAGSQAATVAQGSLSGGYRSRRDQLIQTGALVKSNDKLELVRDELFRSPSQAAAILVGYAINGRDVWRLPDGTTYAEYEERVSQALMNELAASK